MKLIAHRINSKEALGAVPREYGVEIDIRTQGKDLILHHDPFCDGEKLTDWLEAYQHKTIILNVKEEGLESTLIEAMDRHGIKDFFFLDQSIPFLVKYSKLGERRCACRISEYETMDSVMRFAGKIDWVWVDCFTHLPIDKHDANRLKQAGFKLCFVSPELQGRTAEADILQYKKLIADQEIQGDAVCTKRPDLWA